MQLQEADWDSAGGGNAITTTIPNNRNTPIPPSLGFESSSPKRYPLLVVTSYGADEEGANSETITGSCVPTHERGTPGREVFANLGPFMPTSQPISLPANSALPCGDTSVERTFFAGAALYTEVSGHYPAICANPPHA